jgi:hypothetical protein
MTEQQREPEALRRATVKQVIFAVALIAALARLAAAQNASIGESVISRGQASVMSSTFHAVHPPKVPSYCEPCLWYSGDFDPNNFNANGLSNEQDRLFADSHVYAAWTVRGTTTQVSGAFVNSLDTVAGIDNPTPWEIRKDMSDGFCGTVVKSGKAKSTDTPTGRQGFQVNEYTHRVRFKPFGLKPGTYWVNVTPQCFQKGLCLSARYFESTEDDDPRPLNHVGTKNLLNKAIWNSPPLLVHCANPQDTFGGGIFSQFSSGVLGHK